MSELATTVAMESARIFRVILDAMAKPGTPQSLQSTSAAPVPLLANMDNVIKTLCDFQSALWLSPTFNTVAITRHLKFFTSAPIVSAEIEASFAVLTTQDLAGAVGLFNRGTHEYPDRSTTLLVQVKEMSNHDVELSGPGLKNPIGFGVRDLGAPFWAEMIANHARYPLGIDVIFIGPEAIACCPRSTRITMKDCA